MYDSIELDWEWSISRLICEFHAEILHENFYEEYSRERVSNGEFLSIS